MSPSMPRLFGTACYSGRCACRRTPTRSINATYAKGVLEVKVPLTQAEAAVRQIPVTTAE
jgi:hypothetical protein